jgi:UrcA family protein
MNKVISGSSGFRAKFAVAGAILGLLAINHQPAFAQQTTTTVTQETTTEQITIFAPHVVQREIVGRTAIGAPIEVVSLPSRVSYADLDLTRESDANELRRRVGITAIAACKQLNTMYPDSDLYQEIPSDQDCVRNATNGGLYQADQIIAAANGSPIN